MSRIEFQTSKVFLAKNESYAKVGPLDAAFDWASKHLDQGNDNSQGTPMLVFNEEMSRVGSDSTYRRMVAIDAMTLMESMNRKTTASFYHEIVPLDGPAKLALDLEIKFGGDAKEQQKILDAFGTTDEAEVTEVCNALVARLISVCVDSLSTLTGRTLIEDSVVVLDCCRPGKFSRHVIFDGSDDQNPSIAFATDQDCRQFVLRVLERAELQNFQKELALLVDLGIYASRHPLRIYYSAKRGAPMLWLRDINNPDAPCNGPLLMRSLRTCFISHSANRPLYRQTKSPMYVSSLYVMRHPDCLPNQLCLSKKISSYASSTSTSSSTSYRRVIPNAGAPGGKLIGALMISKELAAYEPKKAHFFNPSTIIVDCDTLQCSAHRNKQHSDNHKCVYVKVDLLQRNFVQLCNSTYCIDNRAQTPPIQHALNHELNEFVSQYLTSEDWSPGLVVGNDFVAALQLNNK